MKNEIEMTNVERFKIADERFEAFKEFCKHRDCEHCECKASIHGSPYKCILKWLELKHEEELKSCPFCGSKASLQNGLEDYWVLCTNKDCAAALVARSFSSKEEAINAWNSRAT